MYANYGGNSPQADNDLAFVLGGRLSENCNERERERESSRLVTMICRGHAALRRVEYDVPPAGIPLSSSTHVIAKK